MTQIPNAPRPGEALTPEQRLEALENQLYVIYLQVNGLTKLLLDKEVVTQEEVSTEMEALNQEIFRVTKEIIEKQGGEAETADEAPAEAPATEEAAE